MLSSVTWRTIPDREADGTSAGVGLWTDGLDKAGVVVKDFDRTVGELRGRGVEIVLGPFPKSETQRANVLLRDNAGNLLQLIGD